MVTPTCIHRWLMRRRSSASAARQLGPVVDPDRFGRVVALEGHDLVAGVVQHRDHVGQVVLALGVLGGEPAQGRGEQAAPEAVDRGADLVDVALGLGGVERPRRCG